MPTTREEESRLQLRTLLIASVASLAAALVTAQFWVAGTPIAAALTPVIVAIVSELLHRPTQAIARRVTTERTAILPPTGDERSEVRVYRPERRGLGRVHPRVVVITALLAFAIAAAALTLPELLAGQSIGKGDGKTTLFGGRDRSDDESPREPGPGQTTPEDQTPEQPTDEEQPSTETQTQDQETPPAEEPPATTEDPPLTVPTVPVDPGNR